MERSRKNEATALFPCKDIKETKKYDFRNIKDKLLSFDYIHSVHDCLHFLTCFCYVLSNCVMCGIIFALPTRDFCSKLSITDSHLVLSLFNERGIFLIFQPNGCSNTPKDAAYNCCDHLSDLQVGLPWNSTHSTTQLLKKPLECRAKNISSISLPYRKAFHPLGFAAFHLTFR